MQILGLEVTIIWIPLRFATIVYDNVIKPIHIFVYSI